MNYGLNVAAQVARQIRIIQITLDKLGAAPYQVLDTLGAPPVDPHVQALLQGETRKAPANEAACAGDQNFHVLPRVLSFFIAVALTPTVTPTAPAIGR